MQTLAMAPTADAWPALVGQIGRSGFWPALLDTCQGLSPTSVAIYRQRAFAKLGLRRQVELFGLLSRRA